MANIPPASENLNEASDLIQKTQGLLAEAGKTKTEVTENLAKISQLLDIEKKRASGVLSKFRLDGQVALVTGGSRGIGLACAHALGEAGCKVAVASINIENAQRAAAELQEKGIPSLAIRADVSKKADVDAMVQTVLDTWGDLHIAVNNAGTTMPKNAVDLTEEEYDLMLNTNLKGVFLCCQAEARHMLSKGYGRIINVASITASAVLRPQPHSAYNASKAGVFHLTKSLAAEWVDRGVTVNSVSPGYMETDILRGEDREPWRRIWTELIPMKRIGTTDELQGIFIFIASSLSSYMTGSDIVIDGGYLIW